MTTTTTTIAPYSDVPNATLSLMGAKKSLYFAERALIIVKDSLRDAELRVNEASKNVGFAECALEQASEEELHTRLILPLKRKAEADADEALHEAKAARREAFKERVRAAGLRTTHIRLTRDELEALDTYSPHSPSYTPTSP